MVEGFECSMRHKAAIINSQISSFHNIWQVSLSTLACILHGDQVCMKQISYRGAFDGNSERTKNLHRTRNRIGLRTAGPHNGREH